MDTKADQTVDFIWDPAVIVCFDKTGTSHVRGRNQILIALLAGMPLVAGAIVTTASTASSPKVVQVLAAVASPLAILQGRSPGARPAGVMQTKFAARPHPTQRVLSQIRDRPAPAVPTAPPGLSPAALGNLPVLGPGPALANGPAGLIVPASAPIGGPVGPVLLAPLTPPVDTPVITPVAPQPPPAVPEPVTWATLLTGLAVLSGRLRLERRRRVEPVTSIAG